MFRDSQDQTAALRGTSGTPVRLLSVFSRASSLQALGLLEALLEALSQYLE